MIQINTQNLTDNTSSVIQTQKTDSDSRIIKASELAVAVSSGNNFMSLYSGQNNIEDIASGAMNFDVRNNKDFLAVMANTVSGKDFNRMMEDGFRPGDMEEAESLNTLDKIKATMAESGMVIEGYNDDLTLDQIEEATGSKMAAEALMKEFKDRDLSINSGNINEISDVYKKASEITEITDGMCDYILRNAVEPTIDNLYRVRFCAAEFPFKEAGYFSDEYGHIVKDADAQITDSEYFNTKIMKLADEIGVQGEEERKELLNEGTWLIKSKILCNTSTLSILHDLRGLELPLSEDETAKALANAIERGEGARKAEFTKRDNLLERAKNADRTIKEATDEKLWALIEEEKTLNIENLSTVSPSNAEDLTANAEDPRLIASRRILEETRLRMSVEVNYSLVKRGFTLETTALEETVNVLKALEDRVNREMFGSDEVQASEKASLWKESRQVIAEMPYMPVRAVGEAIKSADVFTLKLTYETGVILKEQYEKAQKTYEAVGTEVRGDLGDDIKKAFEGTDDILKRENLEPTDLLRKSVRILGYSETEITRENILDISEKESMLERVIAKMTPASTLELIRDGVNPLQISMEELEERLDAYSSKSERKTENFASFICRLDRAGNVTEEEKESFIGIYRLLDKVEKSDGSALGNLVKAEAEVNFKNLLTAVRTGKAKGLDFKLDDSLKDLVESSGYKYDISQQISTAFEAFVKSEDNSQNEYFRREFEEYRNMLVRDDVNAAEELGFLGEKVTGENIKAMTQIIADDKNYNPWKKMEELADSLEDDELKAKMYGLSETFEDKETVKEAYENVVSEAQDAIERIAESGITDYTDIKAMKLAFKQIGIISKMTREENYEVPVEMGDETVNIRVKITHRAEKEGKVFASFENEEYGKVLAQFGIRDGSLSALLASSDSKGLERLKESGSLEENFQNAGFEEVTFNYIQTDIINVDYFRQHFDSGENDEVTTKQLYNIAKTFIQTIKKAGN